MFAIGDSLREARNRRGLSAADVQTGIRIRERYLTALEEERWELLPGDAYTKGFLRTYAEFLGLDGNLYVDEYNAQLVRGDDDPPLALDSLTAVHRTRRGMLRTLMGVLVLGAAVASLAAWGMAGAAPRSAHGTPPSRATHRVSHVVQALPAVAPVASTTPALPARTAIRATRGSCWLSIRTGGPAGSIVYQGTLAQGKTLRYTVGRSLWMRMGRPANLDIVLAGHRVNGLPGAPANVLLTPRGPQAA